MAVSERDFRFRANQLLSLDFEDATPRIVGFIRWLEGDAQGEAVLRELRARDIQPLLTHAGDQRPPRPETPEDVAAVALAMIDAAAEQNTQIFQIGFKLGIRAYTTKIQDTSDEISKRYIRPLLQYIQAQLFEARSSGTPDSKPMNAKDVFVVHGRNAGLRRSLFAFLRSLGLNPLEWETIVASTKKGAPYIGEILDVAFKQAGAVVVLLTPDDEGRLKPEFLIASDGQDERELTGQARGNVLFEAGMAFGHHANKTILVQIGKIRPFSDIGGRHVIHLSNDSAARQRLLNRLQAVGCDVDARGTDWHHEGDFTAEPSGSGHEENSALSQASHHSHDPLDEAHTLLKKVNRKSQPKQLAAAATHSGSRDRTDLEHQILLFLTEHPGATDREVAIQLGASVEKVRFYLEELEGAEFVYGSHFYTGQASRYRIGQEGRRYLIERDLLR
jgi:predicted nucleotide-binding protein